MASPARPSPRREQLLEAAYLYVLEHGLSELSLRPLAQAIGSSPRVLLFLFRSKDGLIKALLARAREEERALIEELRAADEATLPAVANWIWHWLAAPEHRGLLVLWAESYTRSLVEPHGAWSGFASATVEDWLQLLADAQPPELRDTPQALTERTLVLAVLRGALLDLLATGDQRRTTAAVQLAIGANTHP
ncbi:MAG: TetR/AcrR family transcriptional regulator [Solirubrobacterales bacterium]|nr:TetR/AcrR family transcriptional regulator [Solirubrobacterales bacterium]